MVGTLTVPGAASASTTAAVPPRRVWAPAISSRHANFDTTCAESQQYDPL